MSKTSFALAAAIALAILTGGISAASAGGMHGMRMHSAPMPMHLQNNFFRHHRGIGLIVANATGGGCGYLYDRWLATGNFYWKHRYEDCRIDW
jgi:hypothetical protein